MGGVVPHLAQDLHIQNIKKVADSCLHKAQLTVHDVDAVAVTVKPGLPLSLLVGLNYAKFLVLETG